MSDSAIISILKQYSEIFIRNDMIIDGCRYVLWIIITRILAPISAACEGLYDKAFGLVTFGTSAGVGNFISSGAPVLIAVICLSLMMLGFVLIFWHEKKPKFVINILVLVLVASSSAYLMGLMSSAVNQGKDAILGSTSSVQTYQTISSSLYDLRYIDQSVGLKNVSKPYPTRTLSKEEIRAIDINEVVNPRSEGLSDSAKSILSSYVFSVGGYDSLITVSDGLTLFATGDSNALMNEYYYRFNWDTWNILLTLIGGVILYIAMTYKVIRLEFELGVYRVLAYIEAANLNSTQKVLKVLDAIKNAYIVLLMTCVMIKFYGLACTAIDGMTSATEIQRSIYKIFLVIAVIDGPNLIQQLFGIDVGLRSIVGTMIAGGQAGSVAIKALGGGAKAIGGLVGGLLAGKADKDDGSVAGNENNRIGADRSDVKNAEERNQGEAAGPHESAASSDSLNGGRSYGSGPQMAEDSGYNPQPSENNPIFGDVGGIKEGTSPTGSNTAGEGIKEGPPPSGGSFGGNSGKPPSGGRGASRDPGRSSEKMITGTDKTEGADLAAQAQSKSGEPDHQNENEGQPKNEQDGREESMETAQPASGEERRSGEIHDEQRASLNGRTGSGSQSGAVGMNNENGMSESGMSARAPGKIPGLSEESNLFRGLDTSRAGGSGATVGQQDISDSPNMGSSGTEGVLPGSDIQGEGESGANSISTTAPLENTKSGWSSSGGNNSSMDSPSTHHGLSSEGSPVGTGTGNSNTSGSVDSPHEMNSYSGSILSGMKENAAGGSKETGVPSDMISVPGSDITQGIPESYEHPVMDGKENNDTQPSAGNSRGNESGHNSGNRADTRPSGSMNNMAAPEPDRTDYKEKTNSKGGYKDLTTPPGSGRKGDKKK